MSSPIKDQVLIHIIVVGFHHKKGCQVEFCYPPFHEEDDLDKPHLPEEWRCLPFLALPDGAHNYEEDTIYFHLPPRTHFSSQSTVYGVSCYRQISAHLLKRRDIDVTRETVQKSVVVLSQLPVYGILHAKLKMITEAYFEEKDFTKNEILKELFIHMNLQINGIDESRRYFGLTPRSLVLKFQHKILVLFKLILLERRILFYTSPVHKLVGGIMSLLCLFPNMIEKGLGECTVTLKSYHEKKKVLTQKIKPQTYDGKRQSLPESEDDVFSENQEVSSLLTISEERNKLLCSSVDKNCSEFVKIPPSTNTNFPNDADGIVLSSLADEPPSLPRQSTNSIWDATSEAALNIAATVTSGLENLSSTLSSTLYNVEHLDGSHFDSISEIEDEEEEDKLQMGFKNSRLEIKSESPAKSAFQEPKLTDLDIADRTVAAVHDNFQSHFQVDEFGFPLSIFTRGYLCLPYVALQQFSDLTDNYERGYLIGATNILFKTQVHLADVVIDLENALLDIRDMNLKRQLHLSAADLRFAENLVNAVSENRAGSVHFDATGWEGGDEWIQAQFTEYLVSLLAFSTLSNPNPKDVNDFNEQFLTAWKNTQNYRVWTSETHRGIVNARASHPCQAQYSVNDMRLRLHHNLQSSDRGRKIEGAMTSANQAMVNTGKYMGTAFVSAKSTVSSWWSNKMKKDT